MLMSSITSGRSGLPCYHAQHLIGHAVRYKGRHGFVNRRIAGSCRVDFPARFRATFRATFRPAGRTVRLCYYHIMQQRAQCPIWGTDCVAHDEEWHRLFFSDRAGGKFLVERPLTDLSVCGLTEDRHKAILTTWIVSQQGKKDPPEVSLDLVKRVIRGELKPMNPIVRAERLLRHVGESSQPGEDILVGQLLEDHNVLAKTESIGANDAYLLARWLVDKGYFDRRHQVESNFFRMTLDGYQRLAELDAPNTDSRQVFVAMWFNDDTKRLRETIKTAIEAAELESYFIDEDSSNQDKICDRIEVEIRRSRLVVADFTHGQDGARGSVYYEAGLAKGLGLPVVWTCRKTQLDDLHFDTNHYPHLSWSDDGLPGFQDRLTDRLRLSVGR